MKDLDFEKQDFNKIIMETEDSLSKVYPKVILEKYHKEFCEKYLFINENKFF